MTRSEAELILREEGKVGYFVVRESHTKDVYSLSVYTRELYVYDVMNRLIYEIQTRCYS